ncbi:hypothetical protein RUM44_011548 [Polyplax serrata]|uniref:Uncharacterized protein n=1 Tax=Polyplax serrata TaxID=468196 RepID=A0ABR1AQN0_POLSC
MEILMDAEVPGDTSGTTELSKKTTPLLGRKPGGKKASTLKELIDETFPTGRAQMMRQKKSKRVKINKGRYSNNREYSQFTPRNQEVGSTKVQSLGYYRTMGAIEATVE